MKTLNTKCIAAIALFATATGVICKADEAQLQLGGLAKEDFDTEGAKVGHWTMDLDAAKKLGADKQLPILLNFTGSDWCYWCKLMEKNIFTKPEWKAYATNHLVMVLIDFPRDKSAVPEKYKERNSQTEVQGENESACDSSIIV